MSTDYLTNPQRVCPVLEAMRYGLADLLPRRKRLELQAPGTADDRLTEARAYMALDWLIRVYLPGFLELSPACREHAERIRKLDRIVDLPSAERAGPVVQRSRAAAREAADFAVMRAVMVATWAAGGTTTDGAAMDAAMDAAVDAVWVAADEAADGAVEDAAWAAAGWACLAAFSDAARRAARVAAVATTVTAAVTAASDAAGGVSEGAVRQAAVLAAWDVARAALIPTVESLQDSAIALYADMIDARIRGGAR